MVLVRGSSPLRRIAEGYKNDQLQTHRVSLIRNRILALHSVHKFTTLSYQKTIRGLDFDQIDLLDQPLCVHVHVMAGMNRRRVAHNLSRLP